MTEDAFDAKIAAHIFDDETKALQRLPVLPLPAKGWLSKARNALGMTTAQVARRMKTHQPEISRIERREREGKATLAQMEETARAMGCKFIYAVVPDGTSVSAMVEKRARWMAQKLYEKEIRLARSIRDRGFEDSMRRSKDRYRTLREAELLQTFGLLWKDEWVERG